MDEGGNGTLEAAPRAARACVRTTLAVLLALATVLPACGPGDTSFVRGLLNRQASPAPSTAAAGAIEAFVPEAVRFVEAHRGLRFKETVRVRNLPDRAFADRIVELQRREGEDFTRQARVLRALGLLPPGTDALKAQEELLAAGVVGFYDPKTKELVVRGDRATLAVKHVVVHELVHAVQDQWFSIDDTESPSNDDADIAFAALVEGDATRIEEQYVSSLSTKEREQLAAEESRSGAPPAGAPRVLLQLLAVPYQVGPPFTAALLRAGGQERLDSAFRNRPVASSQVLHPDRYLAGVAPAKVQEPPADGTAFDRGTLGEFLLRLVLEDLAAAGTLTTAQYRDATTGWAGDRYAAWAQDDRFCVRDRLVMRSEADTAALVVALRKLAAARPDVRLEEGTQPVLTACA